MAMLASQNVAGNVDVISETENVLFDFKKQDFDKIISCRKCNFTITGKTWLSHRIK